MSKKQDKPETAPLSKEEVWQRSPQITRSQIFSSGTVQRWLELADQAFESDVAASEEAPVAAEIPAEIPSDKSRSSQDENPGPKLARAKSA